MISLEQGVELVWHALKDMIGGEIYVKKIPSMKVIDVANVIAPNITQEIIGIRPGEKLHEQMISVEDSPYTYEYSDHFKILPAIHGWNNDQLRVGSGKLVSKSFIYTSDQNIEWMSPSSLALWVKKNLNDIGNI